MSDTCRQEEKDGGRGGQPGQLAGPWSASRLPSAYLDSLTHDTRSRVFSLGQETAALLDAWAVTHPAVRRVRVKPLSLSIAAAAPFGSVEALVSTARVSLWVFALDDLFDEGDQCHSELKLRAGRLRQAVTGCPEKGRSDELAETLLEIRQDLARYPLFPELEAGWVRAMTGTIDGMVRELTWRRSVQRVGHSEMPTYKEYLANGLYSIGGPPHIWSSLITTNDPSTPSHLVHLHLMEQIASTCIRLANDLQTHAREGLEGKFNSLDILTRQFRKEGRLAEKAMDWARNRVGEDIADGIRRLELLAQEPQTVTGQPEALISNIARFVCEFYTRHDFHTFAVDSA